MDFELYLADAQPGVSGTHMYMYVLLLHSENVYMHMCMYTPTIWSHMLHVE